jgi:hypothetical protein
MPRRRELPDNVTYDAKESSYPRPLVWTLAFWGIPSPKRAGLRADSSKPDRSADE